MSPSALEHGLVPEGLVHRDIRFRQPVNIVEARDTLSLHVPTEKIAISSNEWIFTLEGNQKVLEWFTPICKNLCQLLDLPPNWDSYGAAPPNAIAIDTAEDILELLWDMSVKPSRIAPSVDEGVVISFDAHQGDARIECLNSGEIVAVLTDARGVPNVREVENDRTEFRATAEEIASALSLGPAFSNVQDRETGASEL